MPIDGGAAVASGWSRERRRARARGRPSNAAGSAGMSWTRVGSGSRSAFHGTPPWVRVPPLARHRSRRRLVSHRGRWFGLPRSIRFTAGFPRAPRGPRYPRVRPSAGRDRTGRARAASTGFIHELADGAGRFVDKSAASQAARTSGSEACRLWRSIRGRPGPSWPCSSCGSSSDPPIGRSSMSLADRRLVAPPGHPPRRRRGAVPGSASGPSRRPARRPSHGHRRGRNGTGGTGQDEHEAGADAQHARHVELAAHRRARSRAIGRPRPVPVTARGRPSGRTGRRPVRGPRSRCPALRRGPRSPRPRPSNRPVSSTSRAPANLSALAARLVTICSTRRRSPVAARRRGGASTCRRHAAVQRDRQEAGSRPCAAHRRRRTARSRVTSDPDSSRESSSRSPTSAAIDPTIDRPRSRNSRSTASSSTWPSRMRSR